MTEIAVPKSKPILLLAVLLLLAGGALLAQAPLPGGPPYRVGGEVTRPEKISGDPPQYTELARRARITGVVIVEAVIDEQGNIAEARVLKGLPMGLDRMAHDAILTWKFKPATLGGKPVSVYYILTVNFQIDTDLSFGPRLGAFLQKDPAFADLIRSKRYTEAYTELDHWAAERPQDPDLCLARTYALQGMGNFDKAWDVAQACDGSDSYEIFYFFGVNANDHAYIEQDSTESSETVDLALQAVENALAARPDDVDAIWLKSQLLQHKASLMPDDNEDVQTVRAEAAELQKRVDELRSQQGGLTFPEKLSGEPAELTEAARKAGVSGTATIEAVIDEQGNVVDARVVKGLPMGLDEKALEAVRTWKFKPATAGGKPVKVTYVVTMSFR